jgi:ribosomal protein L24
VEHAENLERLHGNAAERFAVGDHVRVVRGEQKNLTGRVIAVGPVAAQSGFSLSLPNVLTIQPPEDSFIKARCSDRGAGPPALTNALQDACHVLPEDVVKYFTVGAHVKVAGGKHKGETGTVVQIIEGAEAGADTIVVFSDLNYTEVRARRVLAPQACLTRVCADARPGSRPGGEHGGEPRRRRARRLPPARPYPAPVRCCALVCLRPARPHGLTAVLCAPAPRRAGTWSASS